jgi:uncharacterized membrane protein YdjX (TVP38/TMEM64 family)
METQHTHQSIDNHSPSNSFTHQSGSQKKQPKTTPKFIFAGLVLGVILVGSIFFDLGSLVLQGLQIIGNLGWVGPVVYVVLYILATVAFIPGSIITLAGGFLFGLGWGTVFVSLGSTIGAGLAFLFGRFLLRDWVSIKTRGNPKFNTLDKAVAQEGWKIVFLTRLSPIFPFNIQNYGYGLTNISFLPYVLASWIGMIPGTIMYVYFGSLAGDFTQLAAGSLAQETSSAQATWVQPLINTLGLLATVAVTILVTRIARKALKKHLET